MTVHLPYGLATDGGTDTETNDGDANEVLAAAVDPSTETSLESLTDPADLRGRDDVSTAENTYTHEEPEHCESTAAGRVIVGVTNDEGGVLLLVTEDGEHAIMPNTVVEAEDDWATVARQTVAEDTDTNVQLDGIEYVRTIEHVVETDDGTRHQNTTQHVLFHGSPVDTTDGGDPTAADDDWHAGWYDELPVDPEEAGDVIADIRTVLN